MEPAMHPTNSSIAYVVSGPDLATDQLAYALLVGDVDGEPRLVEQNARAPHWSPDGTVLAFARLVNGKWEPAVTSLEGNEWDIALPTGDLVDFRWAPNSRRLLVVMAEQSSKNTDLPYRVASSREWGRTVVHSTWIIEPGTDPNRVGGTLTNVSLADWSPDGMQVAVVSDEGVDRDLSLADGLWLWSSSTHETTCMLSPTRPVHAVSWSPDGSSIAYLAAARDNANSALLELWVLDVESSSTRQLGTQLDRSLGRAVRGDDERGIGPPIIEWTEDSRSVLALYADGGRSRLASFTMDGSWDEIEVDEACVLEFSIGRAGLAYSWSDPVTPGEISWLDRATGEKRKTTQVGQQLLSELDLAPTTPLSRVTSDGVRVEGWLTLPDEPSGAPLVLQVHGGPHHAVGERFSFDAQRLAAQGLAVMRSNPRGSQGYGQEFADGILGDWGGRDFEDLIELVDEAVESADLDGERVAVIGESYGGYMAAWATASSEVFSAAVVENGIADLLSSAGGAIGTTFWHSELGGAPWENPSIYLDRSPITRLDRISAPVLVIHCEADETCSIEQGEAVAAGLRQLGRDVEFWRVPDEGHFFNVFGALRRRLARTSLLDEFIVNRLGTVVPDQRHSLEENTS
jgi:dipeptidyl aminopeptidase/acylaminoacyl peptidase